MLCKKLTRICLDCIEKNIEFPSHPKQEKNTNNNKDGDDDEKELFNSQKYKYVYRRFAIVCVDTKKESYFCEFQQNSRKETMINEKLKGQTKTLTILF